MKKLLVFLISLFLTLSLSSCQKKVDALENFINKYNEKYPVNFIDLDPTWISCKSDYILDYINNDKKLIYTKTFNGLVDFEELSFSGDASAVKLESKLITINKNKVEEEKNITFLLKDKKVYYKIEIIDNLTNNTSVVTMGCEDVDYVYFRTLFNPIFFFVANYKKLDQEMFNFYDDHVSFNWHEEDHYNLNHYIKYRNTLLECYYNENYDFYKIVENENCIHNAAHKDNILKYNYNSSITLEFSKSIDFEVPLTYDKKIEHKDLPYIDFSYPTEFNTNSKI